MVVVYALTLKQIQSNIHNKKRIIYAIRVNRLRWEREREEKNEIESPNERRKKKLLLLLLRWTNKIFQNGVSISEFFFFYFSTARFFAVGALACQCIGGKNEMRTNWPNAKSVHSSYVYVSRTKMIVVQME